MKGAQDRRLFAQMFTGMCEYFDKKYSETLLEIYFRGLEDLTVNLVSEAINLAIGSLKFFPKIVELREFVSKSSDEQALIAWGQLTEAVQRAGHWSSVLFVDGKIARVVILLGGWQEVCSWEMDQIHFRRNDFLKAYRALATNDCQQQVLPGFHELQNRANGYLGHIPDPVVIGEGPIMIEAKRNQHQKLVDECVDTVLLNAGDLKGEI
jgi:hypothetical protein